MRHASVRNSGLQARKERDDNCPHEKQNFSFSADANDGGYPVVLANAEFCMNELGQVLKSFVLQFTSMILNFGQNCGMRIRTTSCGSSYFSFSGSQPLTIKLANEVDPVTPPGFLNRSQADVNNISDLMSARRR
ncbi:hypothetical protein POM88_001113 [Heracleum sosnowskyi]|uniref:Uncharacterized protein n=1 Tax=Heracleum sosnowskyi TaxID=360622 RepID=A0AAD8NBG3_9APIA|nr:hypothetical protein POM88_001113 [Heracleum sosnowskyi]